ncbi:MAG: hypothetical protein WBM39_06175 [Parasphingorhabdus sp.]
MNRTRAIALVAIMPIILGVAACSAQAPAEQAEAPMEPNRKPAAPVSPPTADEPGQAVPEKVNAIGFCSAKEPAIFSCQLKGRKVVSVCGTENEAGTKTAQYRFGVPGKSPELVWPGTAGKDRLTFASVPYSGGGEAQISFARGDVTYVVYSRMVRTNFAAGEPNHPEMTDGILVLKGKKTVSDLVCADRDVVPVDYDLATQYANRSDEAFVIPGE